MHITWREGTRNLTCQIRTTFNHSLLLRCLQAPKVATHSQRRKTLWCGNHQVRNLSTEAQSLEAGVLHGLLPSLASRLEETSQCLASHSQETQVPVSLLCRTTPSHGYRTCLAQDPTQARGRLGEQFRMTALSCRVSILTVRDLTQILYACSRGT